MSFLWGLMPMALLVGAVGAASPCVNARVRALCRTLSAGCGDRVRTCVFLVERRFTTTGTTPRSFRLPSQHTAGVDHLVRTANASQSQPCRVGSLLMATLSRDRSHTPDGRAYAIENGVATSSSHCVAAELGGADPGPFSSTDRRVARYHAGSRRDRSSWPALHGLDDLRRLAEQQRTSRACRLVHTKRLMRPLLTARAIAIEGPYALVPASAVYSVRSGRTG